MRERRTVAEEHVEKSQKFDVPAKDRETERKRRREQETDRSPHPGPERRGHDHGDWREANTATVKKGLYELAHDRLDNEIEGRGPEHHRPAAADSQR